MEIKDMSIEEIETRSLEIENLLTDDNADIDALSEEVKALEERKAFLLAEVEERKKKVAEVLKAPTIEKTQKEEVRKKMNLTEMRSSEQYINAYAEYIKTGNAKEIRNLLSKVEYRDGEAIEGDGDTTVVAKVVSELAPFANVGENDGVVPVPTYVEDRIQTAWQKSDLLRRIPKLFGVKGIYKVGFEISASPAQVHEEGGPAVDPEQLLLGIAQIEQNTIKKWLRASDEVLNYKGRVFLDYLYDEIEYQIVKLAEDKVVDLMENASATTTSYAIGVPTITIDTTNAPDIFTLAEARLSDEARDPVAIMNKRTWAYFKTLRNQLGARYDDIFNGMEVVFNNSVAEYTPGGEPDEDTVIALVADLNGLRATFPNEREEVEFKFDDKTEMANDIVRILGKMQIGLGLVAPGRAVKVIMAGTGGI